MFTYRWFKSLNVSIASERKQRTLAKEILGDNLVAEKGAFSFPVDKGGESPLSTFPTLLPRWLNSLINMRGKCD